MAHRPVQTPKRGGPAALEERQCERQSSPVRSTKEQCHQSGKRCSRTAGCERGHMRRRLPRDSAGAGDRSAAVTVRPIPDKPDWTSLRCRQRWCARGRRDCGQSKPSLNSNCQKPGESNFVPLQRHHTLHAMTSLTLAKSRKVWRATQQRSLGEDRRDLRLRIHRRLQTCMNTGDLCYSPVEIWCITAGKGVPLQRKWCALRRTLLTQLLRRLLR